MLITLRTVLVLVACCGLAYAGPAGLTLIESHAADPLPSASFRFWTTETPVDFYFAGSTASYTSTIYLDVLGSEPASILLFNNHSASAGDHVRYTPTGAGVEVQFRLFVVNSGYTFRSGDASGNPDNKYHVAVTSWNADSQVGFTGLFVGFEDWYSVGGGDFDYNDLMLVARGISDQTPEPGTLLLVAGALLTAFAVRRFV